MQIELKKEREIRKDVETELANSVETNKLSQYYDGVSKLIRSSNPPDIKISTNVIVDDISVWECQNSLSANSHKSISSTDDKNGSSRAQEEKTEEVMAEEPPSRTSIVGSSGITNETESNYSYDISLQWGVAGNSVPSTHSSGSYSCYLGLEKIITTKKHRPG